MRKIWFTITHKKRACAVIIGFLFVTGYFVILAFGINFPIINPAPPRTEIPCATSAWFAPNTRENHLGEHDADLVFYLRYDGVLTTNEKVTIEGSGFVVNKSATMDVEFIAAKIFYTYAYPQQKNNDGLPEEWQINLVKSNDTFLSDSADFYFPTPGDYELTLAMMRTSGKFSEATSQYVQVIHVESESQNEIEKMNKIIFGVTIAAFYFGIIEALKSISEFWREH